MNISTVRRSLLFTLFAAAMSLLGCGNLSQAQARDQATTHACDWYQKCGDIGSGQKYENRDQCEVDVRSQFNNYWPPDQCGSVKQDDLNVCLTAIDNTVCGNGLDFFNTIFNKCSQSVVCAASASDAG